MNKNAGLITLPAAIIIAGALVAISLVIIYKPEGIKRNSIAKGDTPLFPSSELSIPPVTSADHILGNPNAPIKLIEYSDPSCPYCKQFNVVMTSIMDKYGPDGNVAWIYRQLPAYKPDMSGNILHPNSGIQSEAFECAGALGGNKAFFDYESKWFLSFPIDGANRSASEDKAEMLKVAKEAGLDSVAFNNCMSSARFKDKVEEQFTSALNAGIDGTPYLVIITPSGNKLNMSGSQTYSTIKNVIDTLLTTIPAKTK